ncbi:MAG: hypothetical protein R6U29_08365, partial [Desulfosudaceae bacterium]
MTQEDFMAGLSILLAAGVLIFVLFSILKKSLPPTAFRSFSSQDKFFSYYRFSLRALSQRTWLLVLPLGLVAAAQLVQIAFAFSSAWPSPADPEWE